jgi:hypothetical protein
MTDSFGPPPSSISTRNAVSPAPSSAQPVLKPASAQPAPVQPVVQPTVVLPVQPAVARGVVRPVVLPASPQPVVQPAVVRQVVVENQSNPSSLSEAGQQLKKAFEKRDEKAQEKAVFAELAFLAQTLNSETNDLNTTIQTINEKLRALNFGVEVWCKGSDGVDFGFCRIGDPSEWQLAARWIDQDFGQVKKENHYAPLLKKNRNERIEGLEVVPEILRKLKEEAEHKVAAIRKAKQLAAAL